MTTRDQRERLIALEKVERIFGETTIRRLATEAKLPVSADLEKFGQSVRASVVQYLSDAAQLQPGEQRNEIALLGRIVRQALENYPEGLEEAIDALARLSPETRTTFDILSYPRTIPEENQLRDRENGRQALALLWGLCNQGAEWKKGRNRPGGKQSRARFTPISASPVVGPGRPANKPEFILCSGLAGAYYKATCRMPPRSANARHHGPFIRLVREVLTLVGAKSVDPVELVNAHGRRMRRPGS